MKPIGDGEKSKLLLAVNGEVADGAGQASRTLILETMQDRFGSLPASAFALESFDTPDGLVRAEAHDLDGIDTWALRYVLSDPDIAGRDWIIEVSSLIEAGQALLSCRMSLFSPERNFGSVTSTPSVIRSVCTNLGFQSGGHKLTSRPHHVGRDVSVGGLFQELTAPNRWWNCIVISGTASQIDAAPLQEALTGAANCFVLPPEHEQDFAALVGTDFKLGRGALRSFRPGFDPHYSEVTAHPAIRKADTRSFDAIKADLIQDAFRLTVERKDIRFKAPSFASIRQLADIHQSDLARASGNEPAQIEALEKLVKTEQRNTEEAVALAIQSDEERQSAQDALANEQAINHGLRLRIETLERQLQTMGSRTETDAPTSYDDIKRWVAENFSGKLRLTPRAEKGLRDARYEKIDDVVSGLRLLAEDYRSLKSGAIDPQAFDTACRGLGFEETRSVSKVTAGQHGDAYFVTYAGKRQFMDRHLKKGTAKDERHCLRIYFFWDATNEIVVVGSLPGHLNV